MVQESGPLAGENFTDDVWKGIFGAEPGVVNDRDGTSYKLTLPTGSDNAVLGSSSQDSTAVVGGFLHKIAAGSTQTVNIPASTNASAGRTDLIVVRYDAGTFATSPGPCRLHRIPGVEGSTNTPSYNQSGPVIDLPLWAVTRKQGQSLNQAAVRDWRRRIGPNIFTPPMTSLPGPIGSRMTRDGKVYRRDVSPSGELQLVLESPVMPRSGWFADYTPENTGTVRPSGSYVRYYGVAIPTKDFARQVRYEVLADIDVVDGNTWVMQIEQVPTGSPNVPGAGQIIATAVLDSGVDGFRHTVDLTANTFIGSGDSFTARVWLRRTRGNDGLGIADQPGYAFRAEWSETSGGNDW